MIAKLCEVSVKKFAKKAKVIFFIVDIVFEVKYQAKGEMMKKIVLALAISSAFAGFAMADNYDEEIKDGELTCTDLIYYSKDLKKKVKDK